MIMGEIQDWRCPVFFKNIIEEVLALLQHNVYVDPNNISNAIDYTWQLRTSTNV
jgi:hypothetical protein